MVDPIRPLIDLKISGARGEGILDVVRRLALGGAPSTASDAEAALFLAIFSADSTTGPPIYASGTSFTVLGADLTRYYSVGRYIRASGSATGTIYGQVATSSYSAGTDTTTVTVTWVSGSLSNEALAVAIVAAPFATQAAYAATLAAAKALIPAGVVLTNGFAIVVAGNTAVNDGYQGTFVYDSSDTTTTFVSDTLGGFVDDQGRRFFRILHDQLPAIANDGNWYGFGDSQMVQGNGHSTDSWITLAADAKGLTPVISAASGNFVADRARAIMAHTPAANHIISVQLGTNDAQNAFADTRGVLNMLTFYSTLTGCLLHLAQGDSALRKTAQAASGTGTWANMSGADDPVGSMSSTNASTRTFTLPRCRYVAIVGWQSAAKFGIGKVTINNHVWGEYSFTPPGVIGTNGSVTLAPFVILIDTAHSVPQTVKVEVVSATDANNVVYLSKVIGFTGEKLSGPVLQIANLAQRGAAGYATGTNAEEATQQLNRLLTLDAIGMLNRVGARVQLLDFANAIDIATDLAADDFHQSDIGAAKMAALATGGIDNGLYPFATRWPDAAAIGFASRMESRPEPTGIDLHSGFIPTVTPAGGTIGWSVIGGRIRKRGSLVQFELQLIAGSISAPTGALTVSGMPWRCISGATNTPPVAVRTADLTTNTGCQGAVLTGLQQVLLEGANAQSLSPLVQASPATQIYVRGSYTTPD